MVTKKVDKTKIEGPFWVFANGTVLNLKPTLDGEEIKKLRENYYWETVRDKYGTLIYAEKYTLEVVDPDQNPDEKLTSMLVAMCDAPDVDLWNRCGMIFPDWFDWGVSPVNDAWGYVGRVWTLLKLHRIPPEVFLRKPPHSLYTYNEILQGIIANAETGEIEAWATNQVDGTIYKIENLTLLKDPTVPEMAGRPLAKPIVQPVRMADFTWEAIMQCVNRDGSSAAVMELDKWNKEDIEYAQLVLNNRSKDTQFPLRPGMRLIPLNFPNPGTAERVIAILERMITNAHSAASLVSQDGPSLGDSGASRLAITYKLISGIQRKIEGQLERLLQPFCDENGYPLYKVKVHMPSPSIDLSELYLKQAAELLKGNNCSPNEHRRLCGAEVISDEEIAANAAHWKENPPAGSRATSDPLASLMNKETTVDETEHEKIAGKTFSNLESVLDKLKTDVIAGVE